jgi:hypothetical protein
MNPVILNKLFNFKIMSEPITYDWTIPGNTNALSFRPWGSFYPKPNTSRGRGVKECCPKRLNHSLSIKLTAVYSVNTKRFFPKPFKVTDNEASLQHSTQQAFSSDKSHFSSFNTFVSISNVIVLPQVAVERATIQFPTWEVRFSHLRPESGYSDRTSSRFYQLP